ncbi:transporter, anaerobic C4-dicarboxylate uptake C family protein [Listeria fleischmannii 1991]|uniref:Cryptic C4-dicarboxylate transporter DcuD n=3 Tax=Listeria fleischmannii TaxID=1069827 RepID=A0A2X3HIQ7_9LIST|nr:C4-dicarboxylate transporter DcuC [Listeria fleischmannii]EMG29300.1 transporter, anaerobic C4-dicarboxylate uptake C (DcuC) family protein [Listeria fleischmannii subsp. fleischmannii LU2006-1]EUJ57916.1 transporter, anaerobic C4-dicarboxylate uptake C family protein [Listeria fleischmannii FSL S10-1203]KMT58762.1 transporter, anaerobic C4-dicarboxylate uptake C family protein [Listeria fleischmannii 1991]SQC71054.1 Putative cryptic C4-dicarboxylate transporter DcuD [Listeria fleischmannii 
MIEIILALLIIVFVFYLIIKKYQPAIVLLIAGLVLLTMALLLGKPLLESADATGFAVLDIFKKLELVFINQLGMVGITIMTLFGFASYMNYLGANDVAVTLLTKPLGRIKAKYVLVPIVFIIGNILSLFVPSASSLAVILMAILYPVLKKIGLSALTAGGVIATVATIMPTPLGADNVIAAKTLGYDLFDYVFLNHAIISIPTLIVMAFAHYFWQKYMDKRQGEKAFVDIDEEKVQQEEKILPPKYYAIFPMLPLIFIVVIGIFFRDIKADVVILTLISFFITIFVEMLRNKAFKKPLDDSFEFFKGMGQGFTQVVVLVVGGVMFAEGMSAIGIIDMLTTSVQHVESAGTMLTFIFSGATFLLGLVSGGGLAMFYATVDLLPNIAASANIDGILLALPMQLIANLVRSISPVAAVIMVVASIIKVSPMEIIKRTSVPVIVGIIMVMILSLIIL